MKKLLILLVLIVLGGVYFFWDNTKLANNPLPPPSNSVNGNENEDVTQLATYSSDTYQVTIEYPADWQAAEVNRYEGIEGFFAADASSAGSLDEAVRTLVEHKLKPYGSSPTITNGIFGGQEGKLIMPSSDQALESKHEAALVVKYPAPVKIDDKSYEYFILYAHKNYVQKLSESVAFYSGTSAGGNIKVTSPKPGEAVGLPLRITGEARVFENRFAYRLRDVNGTVLLEGAADAKAPDVGMFGSFEVKASYLEPHGTAGRLEVFTHSAKDGSEIEKVIIPIRFAPIDAIKVKAFFGNKDIDPGVVNCDKTYAVERRIVRTEAVARAAVNELLAGVQGQEVSRGFFTSINEGVSIKSLTIAGGVAKIDFSEELGANVAGSCRVAAIRSQIVSTLKQFSTVQEVEISINGEKETILQP